MLNLQHSHSLQSRLEMWLSVIVSLSVVAGTFSSPERESRLVATTQGPVRGYKDANEDVFVFYNIPYAKVPKGSHKFKAPLPAPSWTEPFEAIDQKVTCPQYNVSADLIPPGRNMQEDCLIANIYVPNTNTKNLSVVVYFHPGGFIIGYGDMMRPKTMVASKKIIAINFNYRLAAQGFICLGTKDVPGNAGMKDQVALLRWVKQNIANFGGNPEDVTIDGCSAGASSVGLLMISKMASGLFNKIISDSGNILSPFSIQINPIESAKEYARMLKFDNVDDIHALESFYKNASNQLLLSAEVGSRSDYTFLFAPCIERDIGEERFLEDNPITILKSGNFEKFPMLSGFTNMEGLMRIDLFDEWKIQMNNNFSNFLPAGLQFYNKREKGTVARQIKEFYFGKEPVNNKNVLKYVDFLSDVYFTCPTLRSTKLLLDAGYTDIYFYEYSYVDASTPVVPYTDVRGAAHCKQFDAITNEVNVDDDCNLSDEFKNWKSLMRETWSNFIIKGKPESCRLPEWKPVTAKSITYMSLNQTPMLKHSLLEDRCSFWEKIYEKYNQNPIPPTWA